MELFDAICKRTSIRNYTDKPIKREIIEKIVDAGRRAPSARAVEPWEFVVITEKGVLEKLGEISPNGSFIKNSQAAIVLFCRETKYYLEDGCAAIENMLLTITDLGLGSCWIAGDKKEYTKEIGNLLGAADEMKLIGLLSIGWPDESKVQAKKRTVASVIHWERFK